jgi:ribonuclease P protein component
VKKHRLPKSVVVKKSSEFTEIIQNGKHLSSSFFIIAFLNSDTLRMGFTSKRVGNAVRRNSLKRVVRELVRSCEHLWLIQARLIIIIKETARNAPFQLLKNDFEELIFKVAEKTCQ